MDSIAATVVIVFAWLGVGLTILTMPGIWLAVLAAAICQLWRGELISWWTLGAVAGIAALAELVEFVASAAGAAKMGGTKRGATGSLLGALLGAIGGAPFFFPLGTILGGALGAGIGALVFERHGGRMSWRGSMKVGGGAAAGRLVSTMMKGGFAVVVAVVLTVAVLR